MGPQRGLVERAVLGERREADDERAVAAGAHGRRPYVVRRRRGAGPGRTLVGLDAVPERTRQTYRLISADSHVNEPPDLWTARVPAEFRDRAPRIERFDRATRGCSRASPTPSTSG